MYEKKLLQKMTLEKTTLGITVYRKLIGNGYGFQTRSSALAKSLVEIVLWVVDRNGDRLNSGNSQPENLKTTVISSEAVFAAQRPLGEKFQKG